MKRLIMILLCLSFLVPMDGVALGNQAEAAILMDMNSGEVLFEKSSEEKKYPASTTKIMTLILIYEAINEGSLQLTDQITASAYASSMGGSQIYLKEGEVMNVEDLLKSIILASANDACVAFSEYLDGSVDRFVERMNEKAKKLKLKNTHFVNCTGLHDDNHYTCAYDLAMMAKYLLEIAGNHLLQYTTLKEDYIRNGEFWLVNTNKLLSQSDAITGLKTGYTKEAGYCLVSTATKNNQTMISVVMDEDKAKIRNAEALEMINYGFSLYKTHTLFEGGEVVDTLLLPLTKEKVIDMVSQNPINIAIKKEREDVPSYQLEYLGKQTFKQGEHVANLVCENHVYPLYASSDATPLTFIERVMEVWTQLL